MPYSNCGAEIHPPQLGEDFLPSMYLYHNVIIGVSLSEPHTSVTALQDACVCMSVCLLVAIYRKFKLNKQKRRYTYISNLHTC